MFIGSLPPYPGPFKVGCCDIEVPSSSLIPSSGPTTLLVRVFYPTTSTSHKRAYWLPDGVFYSNGTGGVLKIPNLLSTAFVAPWASYIQSQAFENAELSESYPVIVYSHGLIGMRTSYTNLCGALASKGAIVFAIEHRDGSAMATKRQTGDIQFMHEPNLGMIDPTLPQEKQQRAFRAAQIQIRLTEVDETLALIKILNDGSYSITSSVLKSDMFKGRLDQSKMSFIGHSFGGATVMNAFHKKHPFVCGIAIDIWLYTVDEIKPIESPFLTIQTDKFHPINHIDRLMGLYSKFDAKHEFLYYPKTGHLDVMDIGILFGYYIKWISKKNLLDPVHSNSVLDASMADFLKLNGIPLKDDKVLVDQEGLIKGQAAVDRFKEDYLQVPKL